MRTHIHMLGLLALVLTALVASAVPQASLTLKDANSALVNYSCTDWSLDKVCDNPIGSSGYPEPVDGKVQWTVTATKLSVSGAKIAVYGYLTVMNTGSANATIGNIVVNLQKRQLVKKQWQWVSVSADVSDATQGDTATAANIVAAASAEGADWNAACNVPATYVTSGLKGSIGTFSENAASGSLTFVDSDNNTIWAIRPKQVIAPGASVRLVYTAEFDNTLLGLTEGTEVRTETIVSFGNVAARGGSGASAQNIDVDGNGAISADEAYVRSVPSRVTLKVPPFVPVNSTVMLKDEGLTTTGDATYEAVDFQGYDLGVPITDTTTFTVTATGAAAIELGGFITNTATLKGDGLSVTLIIGSQTITNPDGTVTLVPITQDYTVCPPIDLSASDECWVPGTGIIPPFNQLDYITYTQGGWGGTPKGNNPAMLLQTNFATVYPAGVEVGIIGDAGNSMLFTSSTAVSAYLPAGGTADALTVDLVDPGTSSAGVLGGQVLALQLNVDFSNAGIMVTTDPTALLSALKLKGVDLVPDGTTVAEFLAGANYVLGGGDLTVDFSAVNNIASKLNEAFDNGNPTDWAQEHLYK